MLYNPKGSMLSGHVPAFAVAGIVLKPVVLFSQAPLLGLPTPSSPFSLAPVSGPSEAVVVLPVLLPPLALLVGPLESMP